MKRPSVHHHASGVEAPAAGPIARNVRGVAGGARTARGAARDRGRNSSAAAALQPAVAQDTVPVFKPLIESHEIAAAVEALEMGWLGMGSYVGRFEQALQEFLAAHDRHVVAVSTGHAALHLAMMIAGVKEGDEVITPSFNNIADFQAILAVGAQPVFCDVRDGTLCIDLEQAAALITPRTRALIVMDYGCQLADHAGANDLAAGHGLRVIHDAAHSFGSPAVGTRCDITMFSFDPVKTLTCIEGGALVVRSRAEADALREARLIGMGQPASVMYQDRRAWTYDVTRLGFRYHMPNLHAAIGLAQLAKMPAITHSRREACRRYGQRLGGIGEVITPRTDFRDVTPFLYWLRVPLERRDGLRAFLAQRGIDTGIHWQPGHWFSLLKDCRRGVLAVTERIAGEVLSLPLHSGMPLRLVDRVCDAIEEFFAC